jgi:hypothetical protein
MPALADPEPAFAPGAGQQEASGADVLNMAGAGTDLEAKPRETENKATTWLRSRGTGGEALLALADVLSGDPTTWDQRIRRKGEQLVVLFPEGLAGLGATPQAALDALAQSGLLDLNPLAPLRRVIEIDGRHGAPLTLEASRQILALIANDQPGLRKPAAEPPPGAEEASIREKQKRKPAISPVALSASRDTQADDSDPDPARALVERIKARDQTLPGSVSEADGWLHVTPETIRTWAQANGIQPYVLIRTLGHLPGCRVTPDGGLRVREAP